jgi:predicted homoserine dehydrogenase-like protein
VAKRALKAGEMLDGEGGYTVHGKTMPAAASLKTRALPIGLAHGVKLTRDLAAGEVLGQDDVVLDKTTQIIALRREMEARFAG